MQRQRLYANDLTSHPLAQYIQKRYVSQDHAVRTLVSIYSKYETGMTDGTKPFTSCLLLGPTGVGKTRIVELFTEYVMGTNIKPLKVNCGEYGSDHEVAKLLGSPPGYLGHKETAPVFCKLNVEKEDRYGKPCNVILIDEVEKASPKLMQLLLAILDRGEFTTGSGEIVNFKNTFIFMTSNLGAKKMIKELSDTGFVKGEAKYLSDGELEVTVTREAANFFTAEQFNRIDAVICFHPLEPDDIEKILELSLSNLKTMLQMNREVVVSISPDVKHKIVAEGFDRRYGARNLKRAVERLLIEPLSMIVGSNNLRMATIEVDIEDDEVAFYQSNLSVMAAPAASPAPTQVVKEQIDAVSIEHIYGEGQQRYRQPAWTQPASVYITSYAKEHIERYSDPERFRAWSWADSESPRLLTLSGLYDGKPTKIEFAAFRDLLLISNTYDGKRFYKLKLEVINQLKRS